MMIGGVSCLFELATVKPPSPPTSPSATGWAPYIGHGMVAYAALGLIAVVLGIKRLRRR